jgi:hypothetical protein
MKCRLPDMKDFDEKFITKDENFKVLALSSHDINTILQQIAEICFLLKVNVYLVRDDGIVYNSGYSVTYSDASITVSSKTDKESINILETF